jgi:hypothetical protein
VSSGAGALLVSPFKMEWGCYAQARGVEESELCLFLVVFPVWWLEFFSYILLNVFIVGIDKGY